MNNDDLVFDEGFKYETKFYQKGFTRTQGNEKVDNVVTDKESKDSCAKKITNLDNNTTRYYVKLTGGRLTNPYDVYFRRQREKWHQVNELAFNYYIRFLKTNHNQFLHYAEREI